MKLNFQHLGVALMVFGFAALPLAAQDKPVFGDGSKPAPKMTDLFSDPVLVKGKGVEVKRSQLDSELANVRADALAKNQDIPADQLSQYEIKLLDHLVAIQLLKPKATDADKAKAKEEGDRRIELIQKQFPSEDTFLMQLKSRGMTLDGFKARVLDESLFAAVLRSKVTITDDQIKKFYDDNPSQFEEPEMVRASHILMRLKDAKTGADISDEDKKAKRKKLEDLLKRARAGEDFAKLAKEFSEDPGAKENGGEYKFARGQLQLPEFEAAAFSLKTNQVSDVVTTPFGLHIIKLNEKIPARRVELATVSNDVRGFLERQEAEKMLPKYYADLKKEAGVEFLDEKLKTAEVDLAAQIEKAMLLNEAQKSPKPPGK